METFKPTIIFHGPVAEHDMPCAVCHSNPAVYNFDGAIFEPCWQCQSYEWRLVKVVKPIHAFFRWIFRSPESKWSRAPNGRPSTKGNP